MSRPFPPPPANVVWLDETDSTNAVAGRLVERWLEEGHERLGDTVILAGRQWAGRGRGNHGWQSPLGGTYATWLGWVEPGELAWLPLAAGVSVSEAVEALFGAASIGLKWPNDLLLGGRKVGGILCQARRTGTEAWVAVGFGLNVATTPQLAPDDGVTATSLQEAGYRGEAAEFSRQLALAFADRFRALVARPEETRARWLSRTVHVVGAPMCVRAAGRTIEGRFGGLGSDGSLLLEAGRHQVAVFSGEVVASL